ncbi:alpha/beta fold hydrolase [Kitasatospora kifunensis]|uniref:Pimeloyl-ACP methyl ester carboxylesterase n=1 Tax=Kitasatospora kifunensis TaxID=58351 RepID=A0A7W7VY25_KITKI|nr:alpha/beta hydrolase [Kitasatospora kifunensis]MBB4927106.1 pimeloyl-ACP methyl ester carboxylesterase [Kitasatospora kifunensis]
MAELLATSFDGTRITALDDGNGPTLLLVHGSGGDATSWDRVVRSLTDDFRVVRVHRRIYAPGARIAPTYSMALEAADILAIAGLLDRPPFLVGHSSGAVAALEAALRAPTAFVGLSLYEPPLPTRSLIGGVAAQHAQRALAAGDPGEAMRIQLRDIVQVPMEVIEFLLADLAAALPDARTVTLAGQGHAAHLTAPEALADTIRDSARRSFAEYAQS